MSDCLYYYDKRYPNPKDNPQNKNFCSKKTFPNINSRNFKHDDFMEFIQRNYDSFDVENPFKFASDYIKQTSEELCNKEEMSLNPQQKFIGQLVNPNTNIGNMLIYHGLGSGKTCTGLVIGQSFSNKNYKNIILVVPAALEKQYYDEIVGVVRNNEIWSCTSQCIMTDGSGSLKRQFYSNVEEQKNIEQLKSSLSRLERDLSRTPPTDLNKISKLTNAIKVARSNLTRQQNKIQGEVSKVFTITTHDKFINSLMTIKDNKIVKINSRLERNSPLYKEDTVLIIDEIQNLVSESGVKYKILYLALKYYANLQMKKVFLTATPIYDNPYEYALTINLLNPRVPFPTTKMQFNYSFVGKAVENDDGSFACTKRELKDPIDYENVCLLNKDLFRYMSSGYVSYFKGGNPNAYPYKRTIELLHIMKDDNKYSYFEALKKDLKNEIIRMARILKKSLKGGGKDIEKIEGLLFDPFNEKEAAGILPLSRQAVNVSISKENIDFTGDAINNNQEDLDTFKENLQDKIAGGDEQFTDLSTLVNTSLIKTNLAAKIKGLPNELIMNKLEEVSPKFKKAIEIAETQSRPTFVYSNWLGAGVESFAVLLDALGYVKYPAQGPKRYFIWSPSVENDQGIINSARNIFNSPGNADGSLIKYMIGTSSIKEGVSFKNVGQVHILDPWWNNSRIEQITARAIRLCSHKDLPEDERHVDVYRHYTVYESFFDGTSDPEADNILEGLSVDADDYFTLMATDVVKKIYAWCRFLTVDQRIMAIANRKDDINNKFQKLIKSASVDCLMLKDGNIIRLEEFIRQVSKPTDGVYQQYFKNPSTLVPYLRDNTENIINWSSIQNRLISFPNANSLENNFTECEFNEDDNIFVPVEDGSGLTINSSEITKDLNILEENQCWNSSKTLGNLDMDEEDKKYFINSAKFQENLEKFRKTFLLEYNDPDFDGIFFSNNENIKKERILKCISSIIKDKNVPKETITKLKKILKKADTPKQPIDKIKLLIGILGEPESKIDEYLQLYQDDPKLFEQIFNEVI